jgi:hypothetical protein
MAFLIGFEKKKRLTVKLLTVIFSRILYYKNQPVNAAFCCIINKHIRCVRNILSALNVKARGTYTHHSTAKDEKALQDNTDWKLKQSFKIKINTSPAFQLKSVQ